ncbi:MAG TPA: 4-hydroxythreonine-4-phosphate dehydrogenase PdxA [Burkholderiales bacterium]|nr:4-hydroxythreonine-4-phosphate dehydrogenase PdxA [Burkholderiales bacterium]
MSPSLPGVAIATGDPAGIGPEIALKTARDPRVQAICRPTLVGDRGALAAHARACGLSLDGVPLLEREQFGKEKLQIGRIAPAHGLAALDSAETAIRAAMAGDFDAVVAAPHTESAIHAAGVEFDGYPSFVARVAGLPPEDGVLMLCFEHEGREVRIAHVTLHVGVARALQLIDKERIARTIRVVHEVLQKIGIERPRIAVSGINPHASEGGLFGNDEARTVEPALAEARLRGIAVDGPVGADTLIQKKGYDAYVVMFHDQGHVAAKLLAPHRVAGLTIGTPVLFSSVAHGSALDIAGKGIAEHGAMVEAITRLVGRRRRAPAT